MNDNRFLISKILIFFFLFALISLLIGCVNYTVSTDFFNIDSPQGTYIKELSTDQSAYLPEETAALVVSFHDFDYEQSDFKMIVRLTHLSAVIWESSVELNASNMDDAMVSIDLALPNVDLIGYALEVYLYQNEVFVDYDMSAIDVSSAWNVFPRYGYLSKYDYETISEVEEVLFELNKYHLNGLMYYDVIDRHDRPLAGTVDAPSSSWRTINQSVAKKMVVDAFISVGRSYHMNSYVYNLLFGAYDDYQSLGVGEEWGIYQDSFHGSQDYHPLPSAWETNKLYLFNPGNVGWQDYYLAQMQAFLLVYPFDGIQADSLGSRGRLYDYDGNAIYLEKLYANLLSRLKFELDTLVIFNPVDGYGLDEIMNQSFNDIIYMEIWDGTYSSIQATIFDIYDRTHGEIGTVLSAYMNYGNETGYFNEAGVRYTNATILSSGGFHLEMGDNGMLSKEYYPGTMLKMTEQLRQSTKEYNDFEVAYENYLRGPGLSKSEIITIIDDYETSCSGEPEKIWVFSRTKDDASQILHFINFLHVSSSDWVDSYRTKETPPTLKDVEVKCYVDDFPQSVLFATPDLYQGLMIQIDSRTGTDEFGNYITFVLPSLEYYSMVVIQQSR